VLLAPTLVAAWDRRRGVIDADVLDEVAPDVTAACADCHDRLVELPRPARRRRRAGDVEAPTGRSM